MKEKIQHSHETLVILTRRKYSMNMRHFPRMMFARNPALMVTMFTVIASHTALAEVPVVDRWKYTLRQPSEGWQAATFDDEAWNDGFGGFGTRDTPRSRVGTYWSTHNIWLRKSLSLTSLPKTAALLVYHDEDAEIYINGSQVAALHGHTTNYKLVTLPPEGRNSLKIGANMLAVHCRQTGGGQFIDVHLVNADDMPELPDPVPNVSVFKSQIATPWCNQVTAGHVWTQYPRPQLVRNNWKNLNGYWDFAVTPIHQKEVPDTWEGQILVPFSLESRLGGVGRLLQSTEALWYRRSLTMSRIGKRRTLLNFEAVDYRCDVFLNGDFIGSHQGGNTPFSFDVSGAIRNGDNELIVRVEDATEAWQLRGKQSLNPRGIWYTQVSGIWQTVWLEHVGETYVEDLVINTDSDDSSIRVQSKVRGNQQPATVHIVVRDGEDTVAEMDGDPTEISVLIENPKLWSPDSPHLYDLEIALLDAGGQELDRVSSYAGIRKVGKRRDDDGHLHFTLNGQEIFHWGPLDQGWWPDGLLTPPSDEAMLFDIEFLKSAGFNMIRKHIKIEPRRYYYHCDRLGMMVWQDHVSGGRKPPWTRLREDPSDADWPIEQHEQFMYEFEEMIDALENHPSIVVWVPFNEAWGQHRTIEVGGWVMSRDSSRLVNIASGGNFWKLGDIVDHHSYPQPHFPEDIERYREYVKVVGEFGGHALPVVDHMWYPDGANWGYGGIPNDREELKSRYVQSLKLIGELRQRGIAGAVYTQTTDVEAEINGLMTYDRKVEKMPANELHELHQKYIYTDDN